MKNIYVRMPDTRVGQLISIHSKREAGRYEVAVKDEVERQYFNNVEYISQQAWSDYKPTKQPTKRGSKKS